MSYAALDDIAVSHSQLDVVIGDTDGVYSDLSPLSVADVMARMFADLAPEGAPAGAKVPLVLLEESDAESDVDSDDEDLYDTEAGEEERVGAIAVLNAAELRRITSLHVATLSAHSFYVDMPDGVRLRFTNCLAAWYARRCYYAAGGARADLAALFTAEGQLGCMSSTRALRRNYLRLLQKEGVQERKQAWADAQQEAMLLAICERAAEDKAFARHCRVAARDGLAKPVPYASAIKQAGRMLLAAAE
jgi:hypothetical protein